MDPDLNRRQLQTERNRADPPNLDYNPVEREVMEEVRPTDRGFVDDPQESLDSDSDSD